MQKGEVMSFTVEEISDLRGFTVEWSEVGNYFLSRRNTLYHSTDLEPPFSPFAVIESTLWKHLASRSRLAQRLLRFQVTNVVPLPNGDVFVTFDKSVGLIRDGRYRDLGGLVRPCRVLRSACALDADGSIFFGEYLANDERGEMRVYKYEAGSDELDVIYTFPSGSIKHIHGIYFDALTKSLFCLTGDDLRECQIIQTFDEFQTLVRVGQGDETWRAVSLLFSEGSLYYGMDAEFRTNHIYRFDRKSRERTSYGEVSGTVFYSKQIGSDMFFTTTAENAQSQKENVAAIWHLDAARGLQEVVKYQKDHWHPTLFQFGTVHFPNFEKPIDKLHFSLVGVREDNRTFCLTRDNPA